MSEQAMPAPRATLDDVSDPSRPAAPRSRATRQRTRALQRRQEAVNISEPERLISAVAGGFFALYGIRRKGWSGLGLAALGTELLRRGMTGHCMAYDALGISTREGELRLTERESADVDTSKAVRARAVETIRRPRAELYRLWRDFSQLPRFMDNLQRVDVLTATRSHWVTAGPAGTRVEWDAEIIAERENEYIEWQSVKPAEVPNRGTVQFVDAVVPGTMSGATGLAAPSDGAATEVIVTLEVQPPAGKVGDMVARAFGKSPQQEVAQALRRFRQIAEGGSALAADTNAAERDGPADRAPLASTGGWSTGGTMGTGATF